MLLAGEGSGWPERGSLTVDELRRYLPDHLAELKRPRFYRFVDQLPVTTTGKKQHFVASRWAREDFQTGVPVR